MRSRHRSIGDVRANSTSFSMAPPRISSEDSVRGHGMYSSESRSVSRGFVRGLSKQFPPLPPPPTPHPSRKNEIVLQAGRLAAEYLVSQGLLPANSLLPKWQNGNFQDFRRHDREGPLPSSDGRASALSRLGSVVVPDVSPSRRRSADDYNSFMSKSNSRGWKRSKYSPCYGSEWDRNSGRTVSWAERPGKGAEKKESDDDYSIRRRGERRSGFDSGTSNQIAAEEITVTVETPGDSGAEMETCVSRADTDSNVTSCSVEVVPMETDTDIMKGLDETGGLKQDTGEIKVSFCADEIIDVMEDAEDSHKQDNSVELSRHASSSLDKPMGLRDLHVQKEMIEEHEQNNSAEMDNRAGLKDFENQVNERNGLLYHCYFGKVPTRPRSSLTPREAKVSKDPYDEENNISDVIPAREIRLSKDCESVQDISSDSPSDDTNIPTPNPSDNFSVPVPVLIEESDDSDSIHALEKGKIASTQCLSDGWPLADKRFKQVGSEFGRSTSLDTLSVEGGFCQLIGNSQMEPKRTEKWVPQSNALFLLPNLETVPLVGHAESMVHTIGETALEAALYTDSRACSDMASSDKRPDITSSFKICDLNFTEAPDAADIPSDTILGNLSSCPSSRENENKLSIDVGLTMSNSFSKSDGFGGQSSGMKEMGVVDVPYQDVSSGKKQEPVYSNLEHFLNHPETSVDLSDVQDGYGYSISHFLSSSVPPDITDLQTDISLHSQEGIHGGVDDPIYLSLGEIPISFLGVWDHSSQEYGKPF